MDKMIFNQIIPRIRVYETRLLDKSKFDRMIDADSAKEALKVLQETEYSIFIGNIKGAEEYEFLLSQELSRLFKVMYEISPVKSLVDLMSIKYDYHNIKVVLKGLFLKEDLSNLIIPVGSLNISELKQLIENKELRDFPEIIREGINDAIYLFENTKDPQEIDIVLDKYMFKSIMHIKKELKDPFIDKYVAALVDSTNLKTLLRVKKQNKDRDFLKSVVIEGGFIDKDIILAMLNDDTENIYGKISKSIYSEYIKNGLDYYSKTGSVSLLEKLIDNYIMKMMKEAKIIPLGPTPLIAYIYAKETEIKLIRIIMVGKKNNISGELIRERLRDIYV